MLKISAVAKLLQALLAALLILSPLHAAPFEQASPRQRTTMSLADIDGKVQSLQDYRGKVVLINFWATWCTPCITELPELTRLQDDLKQQPFQILTVNVGERKRKVSQFVTSIGLKLPVLLDLDSATFMRLGKRQVLPTSLLVDAEGMLRYEAIGNPGWDYQPTLDIIDNLLAEIASPVELTSNSR